MDNLKCLLVQSRLYWADAQANRSYLEVIVREHGGSSDVILFPETFTHGFLGDTQANRESMDGETLHWMKKLSAEFDCVLGGSVAINTPRGTVNRFLWVCPDGELQYYDKRHLFSYGGEDKRYVAGSERKIVHYRGWRICLQTCYDLRFPVWCRNRGDYDAMIFVANWPVPRMAAWDTLLRARAIENQCYVIGVNRIGEDRRGLKYSGGSAVYDPLGEALLELGSEEKNALASLDMEKILGIRSELPFLQDADEFDIRSD